MIDMKELVNSAIAHQAVLKQSDRDIRDNNIRIEDEQRKLNNLINENKLTKFSYEYLDKLVKEESGKFIKSLNDMLNFAFKTIFYDRDYNIEIRTEENHASIRLKYIDEDGNPIDADIKNCGGGTKSVCGCLLQIYFLFKYKSEPILFLDESLSQISVEYVGRFMSLLDELAQKNDLKILLITHDVRFENLDIIKNKYRIENGRAIKEEVSANADNSVAVEA